MVRELGNIIAPLTQRRQGQRHDVDPGSKVLAKLAVFDSGIEVAIGSGDDAHVDTDQLGAADAFELTLLRKAQELVCSTSDMSPISSRKTVPPSAISICLFCALARR